MKRLFIEIDYKINTDHLETMANLFEMKDGWNFYATITSAAHQADLTDLIKEMDEIYMDSALINSGYGIGSGTLFNQLMYRAIEEKITGKKVFIFRKYNEVQWYNLRAELVKKAFKDNELFVYIEVEKELPEYSIPVTVFEWEKVDIKKLIKEKL